MWIVATLAVYAVLWCAGAQVPSWLIVADVVITGLLAVFALVAAIGRTSATDQSGQPPPKRS
jgi:hypothetical protein